MLQEMPNPFIGVAECLGPEQAGAVDLEFVDVCGFGEWFCDVGEHHVDVGVVACLGEYVDLLVHDVEVAAALLQLHPLATALLVFLCFNHYY